jgi:protein O-mannosyl-transferase
MLGLKLAAAVGMVGAAVFLAYLPSLNGGFIWDDRDLITNNSLVMDPAGLFGIWCTTDPIDYWPATNTTFWLEWRLWELNPAGYHATNLILHIAETLLVWIVLRRLSIPGAFLAAVIFALHPVNVESVAWIAQRKNLMAMLFFLLSILWYLKAIQRTTGARPSGARGEAVDDSLHPSSFIPHLSSFYWLSLAAFVLAMLSKGSAAALPVLLLGIVWWLNPQRAATAGEAEKTGDLAYMWRYVGPILPFFVVAGALTAVNMWFQTFGLKEAIRTAGFAERLVGAGCVVWFYIYKAIWPVHLSFVYTNWDIQPGNFLWWLPLGCVLGVTGVLWWYRKRWSRGLLFAWSFFCVALLPVMGFSDAYFMRYALVADHYQHMAIIAAVALAAATWETWHRLASGWVRAAASASAVVILAALTVLTWQQNGQYRDELTLWNDTFTESPDCWMAHINLGKVFLDDDRPQDAMEQSRQALRIKPDCIEALNNLGNAYVQMDQPLEGIKCFQRVLSIRPDYARGLNNMGNALNVAGRFEEAIGYCQKAISLSPYFHEAYFNLGNAFLNTGRTLEAIESYNRALAIKPDYALALNNLGNALYKSGRSQEAIGYCLTALRLNPKLAEAYLNVGNALFSQGRLSEAIGQYRRALALKPNLVQAHYNLGGVLVEAGRPSEAIEPFQRAIELRPRFADAYCRLGLAYAAMHKSPEAAAAAKRALELAQDQGLTTLAAQAEALLNSCDSALPEQREHPAAEGAAAPH